jgi:hypothetical protein
MKCNPSSTQERFTADPSCRRIVASPDKKAFLLRLPPDVWAQLERLAAAELRSVNGQIEYLLRESLARRLGTGGAPPDAAGAQTKPVVQSKAKGARGHPKK